MDVTRKRRWGGPRALRLALCAALALALALPARAEAAEGGTLKLSCEEGKLLSLEARAALAPDIYGALEKECGLLLGGKENIPALPVTATYEEVTLEELIEALVRLTGLPSTLMAMASSGALKLAVLATGTPLPPKATDSANFPPGALGVFEIDEEEAEEAALAAALRQFLLAKTNEERRRALEEIRQIDAGEAGELQAFLRLEDLDEKLEGGLLRSLLAQAQTETDVERNRDLEERRQDLKERIEDLEGEEDEQAERQKEAELRKIREKYYSAQTDEQREQVLQEAVQLGLSPEETIEFIED